MPSDLIPYSVIEPEDEQTPWRFVDRAGHIQPFGKRQVELVTHLSTHACSVRDAAQACDMAPSNAFAALSRPHVKALMLHLLDVRRLTLRSGALSILDDAMHNATGPEERARLALRVLEHLGEDGPRDAPQQTAKGGGGGTTVSVTIGTPYGEQPRDAGQGTTVQGDSQRLSNEGEG